MNFGAPILSNTYKDGKGVITFSGGVKIIPDEAFSGDFSNGSNLTSIILPYGVTEIGDYAFYNCQNIEEINLPESLEEIGNAAFESCHALTEVTIPQSVIKIGDIMFVDCRSLKAFYGKYASADNKCLIDKEGKLINYAIGSKLKTYTIPSNVKTIGAYAFAFDDSLTTITVPSSVVSFYYAAFYECDALSRFSSPFASSDGKCLISDQCVMAFASSGIRSYSIPNGIEGIHHFAFSSSKTLTEVTIPATLQSIGFRAFAECPLLKSVYCKASDVPTVETSGMTSWLGFDDNAAGRKIYVSAKSIAAYKAADGWKEYADVIVGYDFESGTIVPDSPKPDPVKMTISADPSGLYQGMKLSWNAVNGATAFQVAYTVGGKEQMVEIAGSATSYTIAAGTLNDALSYNFTVSALDADDTIIGEGAISAEVFTMCNWKSPDLYLDEVADGHYQIIVSKLVEKNYAYVGGTLEFWKNGQKVYTLTNKIPNETINDWIIGYNGWNLSALIDRRYWKWNNETQEVDIHIIAGGTYTIKYTIEYAVNKNGQWATYNGNGSFIPEANKDSASHVYFANGKSDVLYDGSEVKRIVKTGEWEATFEDKPIYSIYDFQHNAAYVYDNNGYYSNIEPYYGTYANGYNYKDTYTKALLRFSPYEFDFEAAFNVVATLLDGSTKVLTAEEMAKHRLHTEFEFVKYPADGNIEIDGNKLIYKGMDERVRVRGRLYQDGIELATSFDEGERYADYYVNKFNPLCDLSVNPNAPKAIEITEAKKYTINTLDYFDLFESREGNNRPSVWSDGSMVNLIDHSTGTWLIGNGTNGWYKNKTCYDIYQLTSEFQLCSEIPDDYKNIIEWNSTTGELHFDASSGYIPDYELVIPIELQVDSPWSASAAYVELTFIPNITTATEPTNNEIWYTSTDGNIVTPYQTGVFGANIVSNTYKNGKGIIKFDGDVTEIGYQTFLKRSSLTSITIPDSVTKIGVAAFESCSNLTGITIGDSVTEIGEKAFYGCKSLKAFYGKFAADNGRCLINDSTIIAYAETSGTTYTIPDSVTEIGSYAFSGCSNLASVSMGNSVTTIKHHAFYKCSNLASITLPNCINSIGRNAFDSCALTSFIFPTALTSIGDSALSGCPIETLICNTDKPFTLIPNDDYSYYVYEGLGISAKTLSRVEGKYAYYDNKALIVNNHLYAFAGKNSSSSSLTLNNLRIASYAFSGCELASLTLNNCSVYPVAFQDITIGTLNFISSLISECGMSGKVDKLTIDNKSYVGCEAFDIYCKSMYIDTPTVYGDWNDDYWPPFYYSQITEVTFGPNVKRIGTSALQFVKIIYCESTNPPTLEDYAINSSWGSIEHIYVPVKSVNAYKVANGWKDYADAIVGYNF